MGFFCNKPVILAHRGASQLAPENTMKAFELACQYDAKWVELDVQLTRDHEVVVFHDYSINRTTNGAGKLQSLTLNELQAFDAGTWFHQQFEGEQVPLFEHVLHYLRDKGVAINVEIKGRYQGELLVKKTHEIICASQKIKTIP